LSVLWIIVILLKDLMNKIKSMSVIKSNRSADEIESHLERTVASMLECQKNSSYVEAETHRALSEQLKK